MKRTIEQFRQVYSFLFFKIALIFVTSIYPSLIKTCIPGTTMLNFALIIHLLFLKKKSYMKEFYYKHLCH
jgi:uncharacterized membrane protein